MPRCLQRVGRRGSAGPLAVAALLAVSATCIAQPRTAPALDVCSAAYVIGPDDLLDIVVWNNAEITRTVPVRPDGKISLPLLNDVQASGFTPMQLRDELSRSLVEYIATPNVSVMVREVHSFKVTVIGEVKTPGRYELKDRSTVLAVLGVAGGLTEYAARNQIAILRQEAGTLRQIPTPYDKLTAKHGSKDEAAPSGPGVGTFCVQPGDVILVP